MKRFVSVVGIAFVAGGCLGAGVSVATAHSGRRAPTVTLYNVASQAPNPSRDVGTGERLILVIAGEFRTKLAAETAAATFRFGDMRGFTVAPTGDFEGLRAGRWLLVTAFRTQAGADEFIALARAAGASDSRVVVARYLGTLYIGLGQEARPDGTGPQIGPVR